MSCQLTPVLVADYLDDRLSAQQRKTHAAHLANCSFCRAELVALEAVQQQLEGWHDQPAPEWPRAAVATSAHVAEQSVRRLASTDTAAVPTAGRSQRMGSSRQQLIRWLPVAASLLLAVAIITQTTLGLNEHGWSISFGRSALAPVSVPAPAATPEATLSSPVAASGADSPLVRPNIEARPEVYALSLGTDGSAQSSVLTDLCSASIPWSSLSGADVITLTLSARSDTGASQEAVLYQLSPEDLLACQQRVNPAAGSDP